MLQHLEAADRLAELLAQLDVVERHVERGGGEADELDRRAEHQELLQLQGELARLGSGRDHVLGRDMDLGEGKPARRRAVDVALGRDRHVAARDDRQHGLRSGIDRNEKRVRRAAIGDERNAAIEHTGFVVVADAGRAATGPPGGRLGRRHDQAGPAQHDRRALPTRATCPSPATSSRRPRRPRPAAPATAAGPPARTRARDRRRRDPVRRDAPQRRSRAIPRRSPRARLRGPCPRRPPAARAGAWARRDRCTAAQRSRRTGSCCSVSNRSTAYPRSFASARQPEHALGDDVALDLDRPAADRDAPHLEHLAPPD